MNAEEMRAKRQEQSESEELLERYVQLVTEYENMRELLRQYGRCYYCSRNAPHDCKLRDALKDS